MYEAPYELGSAARSYLRSGGTWVCKGCCRAVSPHWSGSCVGCTRSTSGSQMILLRTCF
jgi:hypothetical protein